MRVSVVLPVYNDWRSCAKLASALRAQIEQIETISSAEIFIIDDGSNETLPSEAGREITAARAEVLALPGNVGHQRALVAGIRHASAGRADYVLAMDADGEDRPEAVEKLIAFAFQRPDTVVAATRGLRHEDLSFRILYRAHRILFRLLAGERLDFGNFVLLPVSVARRIIRMPEASTHLAAAILKSKIPLQRITADRGRRYFGTSKMNLESLISHSFSSLSIFTEKIMVRLVVMSFAATLVGAAAATTVVAVRLFSDLATPGWATAASGLLIVLSLQFLSFAGLGTLITLNVSTLRDYLNLQLGGVELAGEPLELSNPSSELPQLGEDRLSKT